MQTHATPFPSGAGAGVCLAFLRAFIAWLGSLAPIARARAAAAQMLRVIGDLLAHPDFSGPDLDEASEAFASDARHIARYLDVADALVSIYIWLLARRQAGLSLRGNGGGIRVLPRSRAPTRAGLMSRYHALHRRFATAGARASRLAARMIPSDALARLNAAIPSSLASASASAPAPLGAPASRRSGSDPHRPGLIERLLAIVRAGPGSHSRHACLNACALESPDSGGAGVCARSLHARPSERWDPGTVAKHQQA